MRWIFICLLYTWSHYFIISLVLWVWLKSTVGRVQLSHDLKMCGYCQSTNIWVNSKAWVMIGGEVGIQSFIFVWFDIYHDTFRRFKSSGILISCFSLPFSAPAFLYLLTVPSLCWSVCFIVIIIVSGSNESRLILDI